MNTPARPNQVLLVGQSESINERASESLERAGFSCLYASDGFDALAVLVAHRPDVVLAQAIMPRLDGYQTCALIKNNHEYEAIPVFLTADREDYVDPNRASLVGSAGYLSPVFSEKEFRVALDATAKDICTLEHA